MFIHQNKFHLQHCFFDAVTLVPNLRTIAGTRFRLLALFLLHPTTAHGRDGFKHWFSFLLHHGPQHVRDDFAKIVHRSISVQGSLSKHASDTLLDL
jgi:hypothetical protein